MIKLSVSKIGREKMKTIVQAGKALLSVIFITVTFGGVPLLAQGETQASCKIKIAPNRPSAVYKVSEKAVFTVSLEGPVDRELKVNFALFDDGRANPCAEGDRVLSPGKASFTVEHKWKRPSFVLLKITVPDVDGTPTLAGAACEPEKLRPSLPKPEDFDAFWSAKKASMDTLPFHEVLAPVPESTNGEIETYSITLDGINGSKIRGYFSKPRGSGPFPVILVVNPAGIYSLDPLTVRNYAKRGAMAIDINAHDIENGKPKQYYGELASGTLMGWNHRGHADRDTSYFLRMFCSCYRAAQYLSSRPEWNKKHFVVQGSSMGGGQAFVTAYLCPKVTAFAANVPALCDHSGPSAGRLAGWPRWVSYANGKPDEKTLAASRYYDCVNFAYTIHAKALVSAGFIDVNCPPSSVYVAFNALAGEKRFFNMPKAGHEAPADWAKERDNFIASELGLEEK
jgi:cephalosporin-C deacetylase-like acetyl esterase